MFLSTKADICIYGGSAGGGKSFGLLLAAIKHIDIAGFGAVIFRKNYNQIYVEGGLLDESKNIYTWIKGAQFRSAPNSRWLFPTGAKVSFAHIERDEELFKWQGSQICAICFDELTHFTERQFFYMFSRNRSTCGIRPYIRATCNPDADSWVAKFIEWWIDPDNGYPIKERSGILRWMLRRDETLYWANSKDELCTQFGLETDQERQEPKSVTFIMSNLFDNQELMIKDPSYLASLKALSLVERERLLYGNWKIRPAAGMYFKRTQVGDILNIIPDDVSIWVRGWDLAATADNNDSACTAGVLIGKRRNGRYIVADVINVRQSAADVRSTIKLTAQSDKIRFKRLRIRLPQDPGQAGKEQAQSYIKFLSGFSVCAVPESGSKETRAEPMAAQWQAGNFDVYLADWNEMYFTQLESFPESRYKDMVDASSSAFAELEHYATTTLGESSDMLRKDSYWQG